VTDNEHTPTMDAIRERYSGNLVWLVERFDRALAAHDAEIRRDQAEKDAGIVRDWGDRHEGVVGTYSARLIEDRIRAQFPSPTPSPETEQENTR